MYKFLFMIACSVIGFAGEKVYLSPSHIEISDEGIFVKNFRGEVATLSNLGYDQQGLFTNHEEFGQIVQCPACGSRYPDNGGPVYCWRKSCPFYGKQIN